MSKIFAPRKSKKERHVHQLSASVDQNLLLRNDEKLLQGAKLMDVRLDKITVKKQVRTKFDDHSLHELAENIKVNGLIQPLVLHREDDKFILLCGERRFRAMYLIKMDEAPCFILENKTNEELMAIQFSENSAREELHYVDKADGILNYQVATGSTERKIQAMLGISKTEVHRSLLIARLDSDLKEAAKSYNIEKYVLLEFDVIPQGHPLREVLRQQILLGQITKRIHLKKVLGLDENEQHSLMTSLRSQQVAPKAAKSLETKGTVPVKNISASAFIKAMDQKSKALNLDSETMELVKSLVQETKEMMEI